MAELRNSPSDAVARRAGVVKGLVIYHFVPRPPLKDAAAHVAEVRTAAIEQVLSNRSGTAALDACWEELRRQADDGTARAWLSLSAAGLLTDRTITRGLRGSPERPHRRLRCSARHWGAGR
jgi:hypothetical protein